MNIDSNNSNQLVDGYMNLYNNQMRSKLLAFSRRNPMGIRIVAPIVLGVEMVLREVVLILGIAEPFFKGLYTLMVKRDASRGVEQLIQDTSQACWRAFENIFVLPARAVIAVLSGINPTMLVLC